MSQTTHHVVLSGCYDTDWSFTSHDACAGARAKIFPTPVTYTLLLIFFFFFFLFFHNPYLVLWRSTNKCYKCMPPPTVLAVYHPTVMLNLYTEKIVLPTNTAPTKTSPLFHGDRAAYWEFVGDRKKTLPSILLANMQSLENKIEDVRVRLPTGHLKL